MTAPQQPHPLRCETCRNREVNPNDDNYCNVIGDFIAGEIEMDTTAKVGCASHSSAPARERLENRGPDEKELYWYERGLCDGVEKAKQSPAPAADALQELESLKQWIIYTAKTDPLFHYTGLVATIECRQAALRQRGEQHE